MIRAAVLGADVSKSRSPAIHNAAFRALGLEGEYVAVSVEARRLPPPGPAAPRRRLSLLERHHPAQARRRRDSPIARDPRCAASGAANTLIFPRAGARAGAR